MKSLYNKNFGNRGEDLACQFLRKQGYKILNRNFLIRGGEIDIIAQDGEYLVFIEVKARFNHEYGLPEESITPWKLKALRKTAYFYIQDKKLYDKACRVDLVAIDYADSKNQPRINLIKSILE